MKKIFDWKIVLGICLVIASAVVYYIHFLIFRDTHHIFIYLIGDVAFVFLEVLLVTMIIHGLLVHREKQNILKKLNMVIGTFFSEVGTELIKKCSSFDPALFKITQYLVVGKDWSNKEFLKVKKEMSEQDFQIESKRGNIVEVKDFLISKRQFLLNLLENPNLLEHDSFTNLLWAVFHLTDELAHRKDLGSLPESDYKHLAGDIKRAYRLLIIQWLDYMKHLKEDYPYLFSLAMRTNPFDSSAKIEVA